MTTPPTSTTQQEPRRRRAVGAFLTLALSLAAIGVSVTGAVFTETDTHGANTFTTGSVSFTQTYSGTELIAASAMAPGDSVKKQVTVTNDGSLELRYALSSATDAADADFLAAQLDMWVWDEAAETDVIANTTCDATPGDLTVSSYLYTQGVLGSVAGTNVFGDATQGAQAGDRVLAAAGSEVLCFYVELPLATSSAYEGTSTTATFTFEAEQTANNA